jgi:hypothetical protein
MKSLELIHFKPNEPLTLTLESNTRPLLLPDSSGCLYSLTSGDLLHLGPRTALALADLKLQPGESFRVCMHQEGKGIPYWSVWLSPETEKGRAAVEMAEEDNDLGRQLQASLALVASNGGTRELRPTGTEGAAIPMPAPNRKPAIAAVAGSRSGKPGAIPLNVAFREIVSFVVAELNASGEQWSENSRQDLVSTLLIAAQKANLLCVWEREAA